MNISFTGYFEVDDGLEEQAKSMIEEVLFDLPILIDIDFEQ